MENENFNFNNLYCSICGSSLIFQYLNENKKIQIFSNKNINLYLINKQCIFPINTEQMQSFILENENIKLFYEKIKNVIPNINLN